MYSFVSSGCSSPFISFGEYEVVVGHQQMMFVQDVDEFSLHTSDVLVMLILHAVEIGAVIAKEKGQPYFRHCCSVNNYNQSAIMNNCRISNIRPLYVNCVYWLSHTMGNGNHIQTMCYHQQIHVPHCQPVSNTRHSSSLRTNKSLCYKSGYQIHVDSFKTPNPNYLKFMPEGHNVMGGEGTLDISDAKFADVSPLARKLFEVTGITRVFYGSDYLSVAKQEDLDWQALKPEIISTISHHFDNKQPLFTGQVAIDDGEVDPNDSETVQFIKQILGSRVRPTVQEDGGDVRFVSFDENSGKLVLRLIGACSSCPSATVTLKHGIQKMLTYYIKQVKEVVAQD